MTELQGRYGVAAALSLGSYLGLKAAMSSPPLGWLPSWAIGPLGIVSTIGLAVSIIVWAWIVLDHFSRKLPIFGKIRDFFFSWRFQWPVVRYFGPRGASLDKFLWIGQINVSTGKLDSESLLEFQFLGFNGSPHRVRFDRVEGVIPYTPTNGTVKLAELPPPQFFKLSWTDPIKPYSEFCLELTQRVSLAVAAEIKTALADNTKPEFRLGGLAIFFRSVDKPKLDARLPLWGGINITQCGPRVISSKIIYANLQAVAGATATAGLGFKGVSIVAR